MTTMATKVKLAVGQPALVITVTEAVEVEGNYGPQARITGTNESGEAVTIYEKLDAVQRQNSRIDIPTLAHMVGVSMAFWKETVTNASGQSFPALRIDTMKDAPSPVPAAPAKPAPARPTARTPQPTTLGGPLPGETPAAADVTATQFALYSVCLDRALHEAIRVGLDKLGGDIAGAVVASAATLYIQANKR